MWPSHHPPQYQRPSAPRPVASKKTEALMQTPDVEAEAKRLFYGDHYTMNSIAETLGIHHDTVRKIIDVTSPKPHVPRTMKETLLTPFVPFIEESLQKTPSLRSTRLIQMLQDRGYKGAISQLRHLVAQIRPKKNRAFLSITCFPGEQAQVDWASFGTLEVGRAFRKLSCFVMTLGYSRATFAVFTFDQSLESFLRGHIRAFNYLGGVPRIILYDNLKSAVLDRQGSVVRFNPTLLKLAGYYSFQPRACNVRSGWEKGRVERTIRYIRDNFFAARTFSEIDHANLQLRGWCDEIANQRDWPQDPRETVWQAWQKDKEHLIECTSHEFSSDEVRPCRSNKLSYVRYDTNDYSVPFQLVGRVLTLVASETTIKILDGNAVVASHKRSYSKGEKIRDNNHFVGLLEQKSQAQAPTQRVELIAIIPEVKPFYEGLVSLGYATGNQTTKLLKLLEIYGADALKRAVEQACERGFYRASYVAQLLANIDCGSKPSLPIEVPSHPCVSHLKVRHHELKTYDTLHNNGENDA